MEKHVPHDAAAGPGPARHLGGASRSSAVAGQLLASLRGGDLAGHTVLPAEVELAAALGVSRTVVRDALGELERAGVVERVRGIGTVVNRDVAALQGRLDLKPEFYDMIRAKGRTPRSDRVYTMRQPATPELAARLGLDPAQAPTLLYVCKRVLADERPVLYSVDILPLALFGGRRLDGIDFGRPIFAILAERCGIEVTNALTHLCAAQGEEAVRQLLHLRPEEALLQLEEVCYDRLCRPVLFCRTCYTSFFDFAIVRKLV